MRKMIQLIEKTYTGQTVSDLEVPHWWKIPKISWVSHVSASCWVFERWATCIRRDESGSAQATGKEISTIYAFGPDRDPYVTISGEQRLKEYLVSWRWDNQRTSRSRQLFKLFNQAFEPMAMGLDWVRPITPACTSAGALYVLLMVDYFSRFLWAKTYVLSEDKVLQEEKPLGA